MPNIQGLPLERRKAMAVSKAQQRATNKYKKSNYDRIELVVPKGNKEAIRMVAENHGQSINAYISAAIDERMAQDASTIPSEAPTAQAEARGISLPPDTLKAAQEAAEAAGEAVPVFVARAVETQAQRDKAALRMGIDPATGDKLKKEA